MEYEKRMYEIDRDRREATGSMDMSIFDDSIKLLTAAKQQLLRY
jgi:hypothetical protein